MGKLTIMLSMIFLLNSCRTAVQRIVCAQIREARLPNLIMKDVSIQFDRCRLRCFNLNDWQTLPLKECKGYENEAGNSLNRPLIECEGVAGFSVEDWASEVRPRIKQLGGLRDDYCSK